MAVSTQGSEPVFLRVRTVTEQVWQDLLMLQPLTCKGEDSAPTEQDWPEKQGAR
jgi:hypothetical protein